MPDYLAEYRRLTGPSCSSGSPLLEFSGGSGQGDANDSPGVSYTGGAADLTPMRNKAREAQEALNDAQKAAEEGRAEDARQAMQRAKSAIDAALGGAIVHGQGGPNAGSFGPR